MGSDRAPKPEVEGAILAARHYGVRVLLVGKEDVIRAELAAHPAAQQLPIEIVHASEVIGMQEKAAHAVKQKRDSSMRVGLRLVRENRAAGFVSAGNTGAAMVTAKLVLGVLPGVDRPALAAVFPTAASTASIMLDVGANVDCKPHNLQQFAIMGEIYFRTMFAGRFTKADCPRVGIALDWRRGNQGQRTHPRDLQDAEDHAHELRRQRRGTGPLQWQRRRHCL